MTAARPLQVTVALGLLLILGVAATLRLADINATPVLPAEDPYTHMALVRQHVETGSVSPLNNPGGLYPPGLHAVLSAVWVFTGMDLYDIMRFGPVLLGVIGVLGVGLLLWRHAGPTAALVGATAYAVAPEVIFRTTMMSPTALDLALLPYLTWVLLETLHGPPASAFLLGAFGLFLAIAHPWVVAIVALAFGAYVVLFFLFPTRAPIRLAGLAWAVGILGASLTTAVTSCAGACGPGFSGTVPPPGGLSWNLVGLLVLGSSLAASYGIHRLARARAAVGGPVPPTFPGSRWVLASALVVAVLWFYGLANAATLPDWVEPVRMFGWVLIACGVLALVVLPIVRDPAHLFGTGLLLSTLPFVLFNPFDSPYWPHRTAVFLGAGLAIVSGTVAAAVARGAAALLERRLHQRPAFNASRPAAVVATVLVALTFTGTVYAATPDAYDGGWYRLYSPCEFEALRAIGADAEKRDSVVVITGDWQAKVVLAALGPSSDSVWLRSDFFSDREARDDLVAILHKEGRDVIVVTDRYLYEQGLETRFLAQAPWQAQLVACQGAGTSNSIVASYLARP